MSKRTQQIFANIASRLKILRKSKEDHEELSKELRMEIDREDLVNFLGLIGIREISDLATELGMQIKVEPLEIEDLTKPLITLPQPANVNDLLCLVRDSMLPCRNSSTDGCVHCSATKSLKVIVTLWSDLHK